MLLLVGSLTIGLILSLLAMGILISFRVVAFEDLTVDGSVTLGGAVAAALIVSGLDPLWATGAACLAGAAAGTATAVMHTKFRINTLLSGILVMTALYSVNLRIMGKSNVPLLSETTLMTRAESLSQWVLGSRESIAVAGWEVPTKELGTLLLAASVTLAAGIVLYLFFRTNFGLAMRAAGDNPQMTRAQGVNVALITVCGLALGNGLNALAVLLAQYQGFADVQMGIGMLVWGLASVIIGESLVGTRQIGWLLVGAVMGSLVFRLLVAIALRWGLNPNDLKLITAAFVLAALVIPKMAALRPKVLKRPSYA